MVIELDHVQIAAPVDSEERTRDFFVTLLGMTEIEKPDTLKANGGCWFAAGSTQLHVGIESPFTPAKKAHPAFRTDDINALYERLTSAGVACQWDELLPGYLRFYCADPFGNRIEILQIKP